MITTSGTLLWQFRGEAPCYYCGVSALNFGNKLKRKRIKMLVDLFSEYVKMSFYFALLFYK
jgi:hypothetical protein